MSVETPSSLSAEAVEATLREELAQGDISLATTQPILRHLLAHADLDLFNDEVIAKVRGMVTHVARQVLFAVAQAEKADNAGVFAEEREHVLGAVLMEDAQILSFAHSLALEAMTAERLSTRSGIDAVLSPLLQELVASTQAEQAKSAMRALSSQARFMEQQRRMELPLAELPESLLATVCQKCESALADEALTSAEAIRNIAAQHDPAKTRVAKITALIHGLGRDVQNALDVDHAGVSIFVTALQMATEQARETAVLSLGENQCARLALSLRAAGLSAAQVEEQFLFLHPDLILPEGFEKIRADRATAVLADSAEIMGRVS